MKISIVSNLFCAIALTLSLASFTTDKKKNLEEKEANAVAFDAGLYRISDTNKVRLSVNKSPNDRIKVVVKDKVGNVYYSEVFEDSNSKYRRVFNLDEMQDGTYYFEMHNKSKKLIKEVQIESSSEKTISLL
ncbi:hypothetical protein DYBT9623_03365 [Dyadobacter sp. CECT 9623]|jgi:hypothetical protein|uniref:Secretion system C-terminal sorting domain-containing protein n=1 Tax=Dyadobacter linearis TaxID=2823330 RepID=A0ABM8USX9_9BACT|nr:MULTISPECIES: hypothetical protein [unclassified Dyadobacter]MCE7061374.1 hypothetical protein [Dyadobacter sp. CY343]CAG5071207.1 hypothetical protein DYBT9623_03365 [Dyadobacter sp. CECT 9623]